jgi:hypothetical protein
MVRARQCMSCVRAIRVTRKVFDVCCNDAQACGLQVGKLQGCLTCYGILHVKMWGATTLARSLARVEPSDWLAISRLPSSGP